MDNSSSYNNYGDASILGSIASGENSVRKTAEKTAVRNPAVNRGILVSYERRTSQESSVKNNPKSKLYDKIVDRVIYRKSMIINLLREEDRHLCSLISNIGRECNIDELVSSAQISVQTVGKEMVSLYVHFKQTVQSLYAQDNIDCLTEILQDSIQKREYLALKMKSMLRSERQKDLLCDFSFIHKMAFDIIVAGALIAMRKKEENLSIMDQLHIEVLIAVIGRIMDFAKEYLYYEHMLLTYDAVFAKLQNNSIDFVTKQYEQFLTDYKFKNVSLLGKSKKISRVNIIYQYAPYDYFAGAREMSMQILLNGAVHMQNICAADVVVSLRIVLGEYLPSLWGSHSQCFANNRGSLSCGNADEWLQYYHERYLMTVVDGRSVLTEGVIFMQDKEIMQQNIWKDNVAVHDQILSTPEKILLKASGEQVRSQKETRGQNAEDVLSKKRKHVVSKYDYDCFGKRIEPECNTHIKFAKSAREFSLYIMGKSLDADNCNTIRDTEESVKRARKDDSTVIDSTSDTPSSSDLSNNYSTAAVGSIAPVFTRVNRSVAEREKSLNYNSQSALQGYCREEVSNAPQDMLFVNQDSSVQLANTTPLSNDLHLLLDSVLRSDQSSSDHSISAQPASTQPANTQFSNALQFMLDFQLPSDQSSNEHSISNPLFMLSTQFSSASPSINQGSEVQSDKER